MCKFIDAIRMCVHMLAECDLEAKWDGTVGRSQEGCRKDVAGRSRGDCKACAVIDFESLGKYKIQKLYKQWSP